MKKIKKSSSGIHPALEAAATAIGEDPKEFVRNLLFAKHEVPVQCGTIVESVKFIPGTTLDEKLGPPPVDIVTGYKVMIIGKAPSVDENMAGLPIAGANAKLLRDTIKKYAGDVSDKWYYTNIVKFMPPDGKKTLAKNWIDMCKTLLDIELEMFKPDFILILGADATKVILGKNATLKSVRSVTTLEHNGSKVLCTTNPSAVAMAPELLPSFERDIEQFVSMVTGKINKVVECYYREITDRAGITTAMEHIADYWRKNPKLPHRLAMDSEWGSNTGRSDFINGKLRTIQLSYKIGQSYVFVLRRCGLVYNPDTCCAEADVAEMLNRLFEIFPDVQIGGHAFRADLKFLEPAGVNCRKPFMRGLDTMLAYHVWHPAEEGFGLEALAMRFTDLGRYDHPVAAWLKENKFDEEELHKCGYAYVPDELLHPYAGADTDVVMRCWDIIVDGLKSEKVSKPYFLDTENTIRIETLYDLYRNVVHNCTEPLNEAETVGILTDKERCRHLTELFDARRTVMLEEFRGLIKWPDFNIRSTNQLQEFLFSMVFGKKSVKPEGAISFSFRAIKTTEKPARDWDRVSEKDIAMGKARPSTDSETCMILSAKDPLVRKLHQLKFIDQQIKNFLRPPIKTASGTVEWDGGLICDIHTDGRTRTTLSQLSETGRHKSSDPNMQNLPKKQEAELRQIFSPDPVKLKSINGWGGKTEDELKELGVLDPAYYTVRSCYIASPGCVLVEADYKQAELNIMAHLANDPDMIAILSDPKRDMHSEMAIKAFRLACAPEEVPKLHPKLRIVAKATVFGLAYGRGAAALARQAKAEGVDTNPDETQQIIDTFFEQFPRVKEHMDKCRATVVDPGYVENAYGRRRYFFPTSNQQDLKANEREAVNSNIQGTVADALNIALYNIYLYRNATNMRFRVVLPVHDAIFLDVPWDEVETVTKEVFPYCMSKGVVVPNTRLTLGVDIAVMRRWGEKMKIEKAIEEARLTEIK